MIFPDLGSRPFAEVNLNELARAWHIKHGHSLMSKVNPMLDPEKCNTMLEDHLDRLQVTWSYGGWMEDRSILWRRSYISKNRVPLHLGVDFNAPAGRRVAVDCFGDVVRIDNDHPESQGWGPRVMIKVERFGETFILVYAHLDPKLNCKVGDRLSPGSVIGWVGKSPYNGGWYPHVHVQVMTMQAYSEFLQAPTDSRIFDGYGRLGDKQRLMYRYPDPLQFVQLW